MPKINDLQDLFLQELRDVLSAEQQILKALPKMIKMATSEELRAAFEKHRGQTEQQVQRLNRVFEKLGSKPRAHKCGGMEGIIDEGSEFLKHDIDDWARDAALIASAQKVEHYEIASYGTLRSYAKILGDEEAVGLLQQTLDEEGETDRELTRHAESGINFEAADDELVKGVDEEQETGIPRRSPGGERSGASRMQ